MAKMKHTDKAIRRDFALRLKAVRKAAGFQHMMTFARELGIEPEAYRRWERGETEPGIANLSKITEITGVSLDFLVAGKLKATEIEKPNPPLSYIR